MTSHNSVFVVLFNIVGTSLKGNIKPRNIFMSALLVQYVLKISICFQFLAIV